MGQEGGRHSRVSIKVGHSGRSHRHVVVVGGERGLAHDTRRVQGRRDGGHGPRPTLSAVVRVAQAQELLDAERRALREALRGVVLRSVEGSRCRYVDCGLWARHCGGFQIHDHRGGCTENATTIAQEMSTSPELESFPGGVSAARKHRHTHSTLHAHLLPLLVERC